MLLYLRSGFYHCYHYYSSVLLKHCSYTVCGCNCYCCYCTIITSNDVTGKRVRSVFVYEIMAAVRMSREDYCEWVRMEVLKAYYWPYWPFSTHLSIFSSFFFIFFFFFLVRTCLLTPLNSSGASDVLYIKLIRNYALDRRCIVCLWYTNTSPVKRCDGAWEW